MFKKILGGILVFLGAFCVYVELQPADFKITRSATFVASPEVIFPQVNDLHSWQTWSPWAKMDPNSQISYSLTLVGMDEKVINSQSAIFNRIMSSTATRSASQFFSAGSMML